MRTGTGSKKQKKKKKKKKKKRGRLTFLASFAEETRLALADEIGQERLADAGVEARRRRRLAGRGPVRDGHVAARRSSVDGHVDLLVGIVHQLVEDLAVDDDALDGAVQVGQAGHVARQRQVRPQAADEQRRVQVQLGERTQRTALVRGAVVQPDARLLAAAADQHAVPSVEADAVR